MRPVAFPITLIVSSKCCCHGLLCFRRHVCFRPEIIGFGLGFCFCIGFNTFDSDRKRPGMNSTFRLTSKANWPFSLIQWTPCLLCLNVTPHSGQTFKRLFRLEMWKFTEVTNKNNDQKTWNHCMFGSVARNQTFSS